MIIHNLHWYKCSCTWNIFSLHRFLRTDYWKQNNKLQSYTSNWLHGAGLKSLLLLSWSRNFLLLYIYILNLKKLFTFYFMKCMHTQGTVRVIQANSFIIRTCNNELPIWSKPSTTNPVVVPHKSWDELPPGNTPYLNAFIIWCCHHSLPIWWEMNGPNCAYVGAELSSLTLNWWNPETNTSIPWHRSYQVSRWRKTYIHYPILVSFEPMISEK